MKREEIARSYRMAKNQREQINILADLNLCSSTEIKRVLIDMGEIEEEHSKVYQKIHEEDAKGEEKVAAKKAIPEVIAKYAYDKLDQLEKQIEVYQQDIKKLEKEYKEIADFLEISK